MIVYTVLVRKEAMRKWRRGEENLERERSWERVGEGEIGKNRWRDRERGVEGRWGEGGRGEMKGR